MVQGESIADPILMLELATDTHRERAHANEELEALQEQVEKVSRAIATNGLGAPTSETSLTETMRTLETMEARDEPLHGDKLPTRKAVEKRRCSSVINSGVSDRGGTGSVCLTAGHEHEQKRAERFAEQRTDFRKAMNANP